jgi:hypothetical protein
MVLFSRRAKPPYVYTKHIQNKTNLQLSHLRGEQREEGEVAGKWTERGREILSNECDIVNHKYRLAICAVFANEAPYLQVIVFLDC